MALNRTKLCCLLVLIASSLFGSTSPKPLEVARQALAAREKVMQRDATAADVDAFLSFCTENLIYEDPVVKMRMEGRDQIRTGMLAFLGLTRAAHIVVTNRIAVANVVVVEQRVSFEAKEEGKSWKPQSRDQVTILEFEGSRIRRIADYWSR